MCEPSKQDIAAIFKRLRSVPTNKVRAPGRAGGSRRLRPAVVTRRTAGAAGRGSARGPARPADRPGPAARCRGACERREGPGSSPPAAGPQVGAGLPACGATRRRCSAGRSAFSLSLGKRRSSRVPGIRIARRRDSSAKNKKQVPKQ